MAVTMLVALAAAAVTLGVWKAHLSIPFSYIHDANFHGMVVKATNEHGWYLHNPDLGAPLGQDLQDFPQGTDNLQIFLMKLLGYVFPHYGAVVNAYFMLTFALIAGCTCLVARRLGLSPPVSLLVSVLFALAPYHFHRFEDHLTLSGYFSVPLGLLVVVWAAQTRAPVVVDASGGMWRRRVRPLVPAVLLCVAVGSTALYYSFFTILLLAVTGLWQCFLQRAGRPLLRCLLLIGVIGLTVVVNDAPTLLYRSQHGRNEGVGQRTYGESDIYGLKISQLFLPIDGHRIPALAKLKGRSQDVPYKGAIPTEGGQSLGIVATAGLIVALGLCLPGVGARLKPSRWDRLRSHLALMTLTCLLCATIAGFSTFLALAGFLEIRAWGRITVVIGLLSLLLLGTLLEGWRERLLDRRRRQAWAVVIAALLLIGVFDQTRSAPPGYEAVHQEFANDASFVEQIEATLGPHAMVFQLPLMPFPEAGAQDGVVPGQMRDYDLLRGYLHSETLRWSYGATKGRPEEWDKTLANKPVPTFLSDIRTVGFTGLYVDRFGFKDNARSLESELARLLPGPPVASANQRLAFYDLRPLSPAGPSPAARAELVVHPVRMTWGPGFHSLEGDQLFYPALPGYANSRWAAQASSLTLDNPLKGSRQVTLHAQVRSNEGTGELRIAGAGQSQSWTIGPDLGAVEATFALPAGASTVTFESSLPGTAGSADGRARSFLVANSWLEDAPPR